MNRLPYANLARGLAPETALVIGALAVLAFDGFVFRRRPRQARLSAAAALAALALAAALGLSLGIGAAGPVFGGVLRLDALAVAVRAGVLVLALISLGAVAGSPAPRSPAEYVAIFLFAATGLLLMGDANQLLTIFLAVEMSSLSLYVLAGFDSSRPESAEAALKYFLFGSMAAAFLLFGFSLLYGLAGTLALPGLTGSHALRAPEALGSVAIVMVLVAFGFKASAAPFHFWAPDVYEGAPPASAALIASASKLAAFGLFARLLWEGLGPAAGSVAALRLVPGWTVVLAVMSAASLLLGNIAALGQTSVRRLLAYSAIGHAGALLLGVMAAGSGGFGPLVYYAATYGVATAGAFGVIAVMERGGGAHAIADLAGLHKRSPLLAACLAVFILSLAGVPPFAGFFGKFAVFASALRLGGLDCPAGWLAALAIVMSAVALYYYLIVLKQALVRDAEAGATPLSVPPAPTAALVAAALLLLVLGLFPSLVLSRL